MKVAEVIKLLDAGYTKEQIEAYEQGMKDAGKEDEPEQVEFEKEKPLEPPAQDNAEAEVEALKTQIETLKTQIQVMNQKNNTFENKPKQTSTDVLSEIFGGK
jgi:archaellum component FlaC